MNQVYFINSRGEERLIGSGETKQEVLDTINKFLDDHNYKSYYMRIYLNKGTNRLRYDVGSHTEFFESDLIFNIGEN